MHPDFPSDPAARIVDLPGGPVSVTDEGAGPVLVALHGLPGSVRDFRWLAPALDGLRVIRIDQPGFGASPLSTLRDPAFDPRARLTLAVLDQLGVDRFVALGHSAGGVLALELAARHPDRVMGLALLAAPGLGPHAAIRRSRAGHLVSPLLNVPVLRDWLTPSLRRGFEQAGFPKNLPDDTLHQSMHILRHLRFRDQRARVAALTVPTALAWTDDDRFIEPAISLAMAGACPEGPRLSFPEGGHYLQKTQATELGAALVPWVQGLAQG